MDFDLWYGIVPIIGDNVYIGPGAIIIGNIRISDNVVIGANAVVLDDLDLNAVAVGNSAITINYRGSEVYKLNKI